MAVYFIAPWFHYSTEIALTFIVPGKPPANLRAYNTSSTSIGVSWDPVPETFQQGIILGYRVYLRVTQQQNRRKRSSQPAGNEIVIHTSNLTAEFLNLEKYSNYCVQAAAYTRIGASNRTNITCLLTDEDGKKICRCSPFIVLSHVRTLVLCNGEGEGAGDTRDTLVANLHGGLGVFLKNSFFNIFLKLFPEKSISNKNKMAQFLVLSTIFQRFFMFR